MHRACLILLTAACVAPPQADRWRVAPLNSPTVVSLRGVCAVSRTIAWASGAQGTCLRTLDGGATWSPCPIPGARDRDLRDVHAFDANVAVAMAVGSPAQIFRTEDGGATWRQVFSEPHAAAFLDALDFVDDTQGFAFGDPIDGVFLTLKTDDGGRTWQRLAAPPVPLSGEAAFAASGTCVDARSGDLAVATGGGAVARVLRWRDGEWRFAPTLARAGQDSRGLFSLARQGSTWLAVGGDYRAAHDDHANFVRSDDDGHTWQLGAGSRPRGFRSCIRFTRLPGVALTCGESGVDLTTDAGHTWRAVADTPLHALSVARDGAVFGVGPRGRIVKIVRE